MIFLSWFKFHWILFIRFQLTIRQEYSELQIYPGDHQNFDGSADHIKPHMFQRKWKKEMERTNDIIDTLSTEYIEQAFTDPSRSFAICVQCLWTILHDGDSETE